MTARLMLWRSRGVVGGACGWGCAGAIDDHDNGEAQREVSKLALSADRTQGKK